MAPTAVAAHIRLETLVVPTRGIDARVELHLRHAVDAAHAHDRRIDLCLATETTADPQVVSDLRVHLQRRGGQLRVIDRGARAQLAEALIAAGCDREAVAFAILDPLRLGDTTGANRNAIQLVTTGERVLSLDDDLDPRLYRPPGTGTAVRVEQGDATEFWFFAGEAEAEALAIDGDPYAPFEHGLALAVGDRPPAAGVWLGTCGDPGTCNGLYLLAQRGPSRTRLLDDDDRYRRQWTQRRVLRAVTHPTIASGHGWTPACVALDHGVLLPPFLPVLRGEGLVFGEIVAAGGAWSLVRMPGALGHRLAAPLEIERETMMTAAASMAGATLLQAILQHAPRPRGVVAPGLALAQLGRGLAELTRTPGRFAELAIHLVRRRAQGLIDELHAALDQQRERPTTWAADVGALLGRLATTVSRPHAWAPYDLVGRVADPRETLRAILQRYALLLAHWPMIVATASRVERGAATPTLV